MAHDAVGQGAPELLQVEPGAHFALETQAAAVARSGLLDKNFWTRVLTVAGYMAMVAFLGVLGLLILWGLMIMAALFLTPGGVTLL